MPECLPFCGWLYNLEKVRPEEVLAPPYDVVSPEEIEFYKKKSPYNIFHLELPENPKKARELLERFIKEEIFLKNGVPTLYYHELAFEYKGKRYLRKGFILLVKLHNFEEGKIIPHEKIYFRVAEERLNLLKETKFQFSQIFGLYEDPSLETFKTLPERVNYFLEVTIGKETQRLAKIQDETLIKKVLSILINKKIYIADGHHRYTTALNYKAYMESLYGKDDARDYNYISMYISPFEDENLLMLPTHRVYKISDSQSFFERIKEFVEIEKEVIASYWEEEIKNFKGESRLFALALGERVYLCSIKKSFFEKLKEKEPELSKLPLWNFLQIFEEIMKIPEEALKAEGKVEFLSQEEEVFKRVKNGYVGIIFPRVSAEILKWVADKGKIMPHKSTYFYPKIHTGLVLAEVSGKKVK